MFIDFIINHAYTSVFIGLLFGGESVLLPAIYLGLIGTLDLGAIILISVIATVISDTFWYYTGRMFPAEKLYSMPFFAKFAKGTELLSKHFTENGLGLLYFSKFIYGTRTAAQILSGSHLIKFRKYFFVNLAGVLSLNAFFVILGFSIKETFFSLMKSPSKIWVALGIFALSSLAIHLVIKNIVYKKWSRQ